MIKKTFQILKINTMQFLKHWLFPEYLKIIKKITFILPSTFGTFNPCTDCKQSTIN